MRKLKLAMVLPIILFAVAALLLQFAGPRDFYVSTPRLICWGLNAPALLFRTLNPIGWGPTFGWLPRSVLGFDTDDLFFLAGVIFVWYFVGRAIDRQGGSKPKARPRTATALIVHTLLLAVGGLLFYLGLRDFQDPTFGNLGHRPYRGILTFLWSGNLIFLSGRALVRVTRRGLARSV